MKSNFKIPYNTKIVVVGFGKERGFDVYLSISGKLEYLSHYEKNALLYSFLKNGRTLQQIERWRPNKESQLKGIRLERSLRYLRRKVYDFLFNNLYEAI